MQAFKNTLDKVGLLKRARLVRDRRHTAVADFDLIYETLQPESRAKSTQRVNRVGVLPAAPSPGGLGDEALLKGLLSFYRTRNVDVVPLSVLEGDRWDFLSEPLATLPRRTLDWMSLGRSLQSLDWIFIIGADVMDGGYGLENSALRLKLAHAANALGIGATITGFSFNERCPPVLAELFRKLGSFTSVCLRDPNSAERFEALTQRPATRVADLAFLMAPAHDAMARRGYHAWVCQEKAAGKKLLGVNICPHTANADFAHYDQRKLMDQVMLYEAALTKFLERNANYSVLLIPHDYRGILSDLNQSLILANRLSKRCSATRVHVVDDWVRADEIKAIAGQMDVVFTGRMHLAIACIGMGTPVACFTYQNKFEGLFDLLDLDRALVSSVAENTADSLAARLQHLADNEAHYRATIDSKTPRIRTLAEQNFHMYQQFFPDVPSPVSRLC